MEKSEKIDIAVKVLNDIWSDIDFSNMPATRMMKIWDEFSNKVKGSAKSSATFEVFIEKLCKKFDIKALSAKDGMIDMVVDMPESDKKEILKVYREELIIIMLKLRMLRGQIKETYRKG